MFWVEWVAFSVEVYLNLVCLSTLDDSIICVTRIPSCCCCCYPSIQQLCDRGEVPTSVFCRWRTEAERVRGHAQSDSVADSKALLCTVWVVVVGSVVRATGVEFTKPPQSSGWAKWAESSTWWIKHWRFEICSRDLIQSVSHTDMQSVYQNWTSAHIYSSSRAGFAGIHQPLPFLSISTWGLPSRHGWLSLTAQVMKTMKVLEKKC